MGWERSGYELVFVIIPILLMRNRDTESFITVSKQGSLPLKPVAGTRSSSFFVIIKNIVIRYLEQAYELFYMRSLI